MLSIRGKISAYKFLAQMGNGKGSFILAKL